MNTQFVINIVLGLVAFLGSFVFYRIFSTLDKLQDLLHQTSSFYDAELKSIREKMSEISISLPTEYVTKNDLYKISDLIDAKLDKLEVKIDNLIDAQTKFLRKSS